MSDVNRVGVRSGRHPANNVARLFPLETAQLPANLQEIRLTGTPNFGFTPEVVDSAEFRQDRQRSKPKLVGFEAGATIGIEVSPRSFDEIFEDAMFSTWVNTLSRVGTATDNIVAFAANTITLEGGAGTLTDFLVGQIVMVEDGVNAATFAEAYEVTAIAANAADTDLTTAHIGPSATDPGLATITANATSVVKVIGWKAQAADEISVTAVSGNLATIDFLGAVASADGAVFGTLASETALVPGVWIKLSGFATATNNVWARIVTVAADQLIVQTPTGAQTMVVEDPGPDDVELYFGDYLRNGTDSVESHSRIVERRFGDHGAGVDPTLETEIGAVVNQLQITLTPKSIAIGSLEFFALNSRVVEDSNKEVGVGGGTAAISIYANGATIPADTPSPTDDVLNTSIDIANIATDFQNLITGTANFPLNVVLTLNNNARRRDAIGFQGSASIGVGEVAVTGNADTYFDDPTELAAVTSNVTKKFNMAAVDPNSGRNMVFDVPSIVYTGGQATSTAKNTDTTVPIPWGGFRDEVLGYTIQMQRGNFST